MGLDPFLRLHDLVSVSSSDHKRIGQNQVVEETSEVVNNVLGSRRVALNKTA